MVRRLHPRVWRISSVGFFFLVSLSSTLVSVVSTRSSKRLQLGKKGDGLPLDKVVMARSKGELAVAEAASQTTDDALGELKAYKAAALTGSYVQQAKEAYEIARLSVSQTRVAMEETRVARRTADETAVKTAAVTDVAKQMATNAATAAGQAVMDQVRAEAREDAVKSAKDAHDNFASRKAQRQADAAAAAMQPYHLAMMRAQKASATFYEKAKSAAAAANALEEKANKLAAQAQALQSGGHPTEAAQVMLMAHGAMGGVVNLVAWANKMYGYASNINPMPYVLYEQMAGNNAAYFSSFNPPMAFPSAALLQEGANASNQESGTEKEKSKAQGQSAKGQSGSGGQLLLRKGKIMSPDA